MTISSISAGIRCCGPPGWWLPGAGSDHDARAAAPRPVRTAHAAGLRVGPRRDRGQPGGAGGGRPHGARGGVRGGMRFQTKSLAVPCTPAQPAVPLPGIDHATDARATPVLREQEGLLYLPNVFSGDEIGTLLEETRSIAQIEHPSRVMKRTTDRAGALHGSHLTSPLMAAARPDPAAAPALRAGRRRGGLRLPVQDQLQGRLRGRRVEMAPGFHLLVQRKGDGMREARCA